MNLTEQVIEYYKIRSLNKPNIWESLGWAISELGEVYEVLMSWNSRWVRNNPQDHPVKTKEDLAEELGDVIMMIIAAGLSEGVDPIAAMRNKMKRKLEEDKQKNRQSSSYIKAEIPVQMEFLDKGIE